MNDNINLFNNREFNFRIFLFLLAVMLLLSPYSSYAAAAEDPFHDSMCNVLRLINGPIGKFLAMLVVLMIGIKVMTGQVREMFQSVIIPIFGIATLLGASKLITFVFPALGAEACY